MSTIDSQGMLVSPRVRPMRQTTLEHGLLKAVNGLILHQTDSPSATSTLNVYRSRSSGLGAHFLIAKDGTIYQTASTKVTCFHVGKLLKSRCLEFSKHQCKDKAVVKMLTLTWSKRISAISKHEKAKSYPARFPMNNDSLGIELVGRHIDDKTFHAVTGAQTIALDWLIEQLYLHFKLDKDDVFRHPEVSYKNPGEAAGATWR